MKLIELSQSRSACVDDKDFKWLSQWKWHYARDISNKTGYAHSYHRQHKISMHIIIMKRYEYWEHGKEVDHINTCGCDNRKVNLRLATQSEQGANGRLQLNNTSGITGVNWYKITGKWVARIMVNGKRKHLDYFEKFNDAVAARLKAEFKYFGEFRHDPANVCPLGYTGECLDCAARLKELQNV